MPIEALCLKLFWIPRCGGRIRRPLASSSVPSTLSHSKAWSSESNPSTFTLNGCSDLTIPILHFDPMSQASRSKVPRSKLPRRKPSRSNHFAENFPQHTFPPQTFLHQTYPQQKHTFPQETFHRIPSRSKPSRSKPSRRKPSRSKTAPRKLSQFLPVETI